MPRNNNGIYSLPQAAFQPGTVISSSAVNSDFSDIAATLTGSVASNGVTPITGQLVSSVTAVPAWTSSVDKTTGWGVSAAGTAAIYVGSSIVGTVTAAGLALTGGLTVGGNLGVTGNAVITGSLTAGLIAFSGTGAIQIPAGTTAQRPASPVQGDIRYNSTTGLFEGYDGTEWQLTSAINQRYTITAAANSPSSNLLTVSILNAITGAAPTAADPLAFLVRDPTLTNGDQTLVLANSALSISTNGAGATLATQNNVPFRFWVLLFNNGGTPELALWHSGAGAAAPAINPLNEGALVNTTGISSAATSAGVFYTPNGVSLTGAPFKILGYIEYGSGLSTAGSYATGPTAIQIFGPGIARPGQAVQSVFPNLTSIAVTSVFSSATATNVTASIAPTSAANLVYYNMVTDWQNSSGAGTYDRITAQMYRGSTGIGNLSHSSGPSATGNEGYPIALSGYDNPGVATSETYTLKVNFLSGATLNVPYNVGSSLGSATMILEEIMG